MLWTKAAKLAEDKNRFRISLQVSAGSISAALYHTAGKGRDWHLYLERRTTTSRA